MAEKKTETKVTNKSNKAKFVSENPYKWVGELGIQFRPDGKADGGVFETDNEIMIKYLSILPDVRRVE